jgi:glycosyltransferase involved in cell wall biosynthesis
MGKRKTMAPLISIIIPIYNIEKYVEQCIDSVIAQSLPDLEIILVDDGSSDRCPAICDRYSSKDKRIKVIHKTNGGLMSAWMAGVKECSAPYIVFVDGDDWIERDMCEIFYLNAESQKADICCSGFFKDYNNSTLKCGALLTKAFEPAEIRNCLVPDLLTYFLKKNPDVVHARWAKIFRREVILDNLSLCNQNISLGEDFNIVFPAFLSAKKILVLGNSYLYHYRTRSGSIMKASFSDAKLDLIRILNEEILKLSEASNYEDIYSVKLFCSFLYYELVRDLCLSNYSLRKKISTVKLIKRTLPRNISFSELYQAFAESNNLTKNKILALKLLSKNRFAAFAILVHATLICHKALTRIIHEA